MLEEYEASDPTALFKRAVDFRAQAAVPHFYGTTNKVMDELLCRFNLQAGGPSGWLHIADAPLHDDPGALEYYLMLIKQRTAKGQKTLQFGKESNLPSMLMALTEEDTSQKPEKFPPVAALGYALAAMEEFDAAEASVQEYVIARARVFAESAAEEF